MIVMAKSPSGVDPHFSPTARGQFTSFACRRRAWFGERSSFRIHRETPMRKPTSVNIRLWVVLLVPALIAVPGCGSDELESPTATKLRTISNFYLEYAIGQNGKGPDNEQTLKKHLRGVPEFVLQTSGIKRDEIDSLFTSERDQEPFVVLYGQTIKQVGGKSAPLVAH